MRVILHGATGRMGRAIESVIDVTDGAQVVARPARGADAPALGAALRGRADVLVDFTGADGVRAALALAEAADVALLTGSTGLDDDSLAALAEASGRRAVLCAPNTSRGVAVLAHIVRVACELLGEAFDADVVEAHHTGKRDAPSGTAKRLAEAIEQGRGRPLPADRIHALRTGQIAGEHEVILAGEGQVLRLRHEAGGREVFAQGAVAAARWLVGRPAGLYSMEDVLGLGRSD